MNCKYCGKECKNENSLKQHEIRCKSNSNRIIVKSNFIAYNEKRKSEGIHGINQYIKAKNDGVILKCSDSTKNKIREKLTGKEWSTERKQNHSLVMQEAVKNHPCSYNASNVNGRIKKQLYKGVILDSSWEVLVAKYLDEHNIAWIKPINGFEYIWKNKIHIYYPDFYLCDYDMYIEVKGYKRDRDVEKWKSLNNLLVIKLSEIRKIKKSTYNIFELLKEKYESYSY